MHVRVTMSRQRVREGEREVYVCVTTREMVVCVTMREMFTCEVCHNGQVAWSSVMCVCVCVCVCVFVCVSVRMRENGRG